MKIQFCFFVNFLKLKDGIILIASCTLFFLHTNAFMLHIQVSHILLVSDELTVLKDSNRLLPLKKVMWGMIYHYKQ